MSTCVLPESMGVEGLLSHDIVIPAKAGMTEPDVELFHIQIPIRQNDDYVGQQRGRGINSPATQLDCVSISSVTKFIFSEPPPP